MIEEILKELREKLADIEHQRWSDWQAYLHTKLIFNQENGVWELPDYLYYHWTKQINTPYEDLSEREKEEDRKQVDRYLPLLKEKLTSFEKKSRKEGIERGKQEFLIIANEYLKKGWSLDKFIGVYSELEIIKSNSIKKEFNCIRDFCEKNN